MPDCEDPEPNEFERGAVEKQRGLAREMLAFLGQDTKFWLAPLVIILLGFGLLVLLGSTSAAPFIYTLF